MKTNENEKERHNDTPKSGETSGENNNPKNKDKNNTPFYTTQEKQSENTCLYIR